MDEVKKAVEIFYNYDSKEFEEREVHDFKNNLYFDKLEPSEFKIYKLVK